MGAALVAAQYEKPVAAVAVPSITAQVSVQEPSAAFDVSTTASVDASDIEYSVLVAAPNVTVSYTRAAYSLDPSYLFTDAVGIADAAVFDFLKVLAESVTASDSIVSTVLTNVGYINGEAINTVPLN